MNEVSRSAERPLISRRDAFAELLQEHKTLLTIIALLILALPSGALFCLGLLILLGIECDRKEGSGITKPGWWFAAVIACGGGSVICVLLCFQAEPENSEAYLTVFALVGGCFVIAVCAAAAAFSVLFWLVLTGFAAVAVSPVVLWVAVTRRSGRSPYKVTQAVAGLPTKMIDLLSSLYDKIE